MRFCVAVLFSIGAASAADIKDAATRAIAAIQSSQKNWYARQSCNSCHHQYLPALAYRSAREHGISVDENIAHNDAVKAFANTDIDQTVQYNYVIEPAMDDAYRLVAGDAAGLKPSLITSIYARLIASRQNPDGHWDSFHQRPPSSYSRFTQTALALRAIQLYSHPTQQADARTGVLKARSWLINNTPPDTEGRTYQLLGLFWSGTDRLTLNKSARALLAMQNKDGGWPSLDGRDSDAYSTGEALVALNDAGGIAITNAAWQRGIDFLLKTQAAAGGGINMDGSWHVESRLYPPAPVSPPYFESGFPYGHDQFISISGTAWAAMALARALGPAQKIPPPPLKEAGPAGIEQWAATVLFGAASDVKRLLDGGLNPNASTKGGTTVLMMAAPDVEKMKLLLDRGAQVNARAKSKYSALMVAAQYQDSMAAIQLLLDHGAEIRAPQGQNALFNAHPLFLAAYAGSANALKPLHDAEGSVEDPMILIGTSSTTPLQGAVRFGNMAVVRSLLDLGAKADAADGSGITPLGRAVLGNQVEIARLLIERGADVNHVDKLGMTPLLYAASIDFGDSNMIDLLLKSGARADARSKDGLTALELAQKYKHTHLVPRLSTP